MFAIVLDRNKQYFMKKDSIVRIDYLKSKIDDLVNLTDILFYNNGESDIIGTPFIENKIVTLQVLKHIKDKKKKILKFRRRKHHMKSMGHRQNYTLLKVIFIGDK